MGIGDRGAGGARAPPPKIRDKYFSANYYRYVKFGHFRAKIM